MENKCEEKIVTKTMPSERRGIRQWWLLVDTFSVIQPLLDILHFTHLQRRGARTFLYRKAYILGIIIGLFSWGPTLIGAKLVPRYESG